MDHCRVTRATIPCPPISRADAKIGLIKSLLPMIDNFERARKSISPEDEEGEATNARYLQLSDMLMATLGEMGVEQIPTVGTEFDYNLHMAIQQVRTATGAWVWQQAGKGTWG